MEELDKYLNAKKPDPEEKLETQIDTFVKTEKGLIKSEFKPSAPDFVVSEQPSVCAWIDKVNTAGEIITMNLKVGELRFKLRKRFL